MVLFILDVRMMKDIGETLISTYGPEVEIPGRNDGKEKEY